MSNLKINGVYYRVYTNNGEQMEVKVMIPYDIVRNFEQYEDSELVIPEDSEFLGVHFMDGTSIIINCSFEAFYNDLTAYKEYVLFKHNNNCTCKA